MSFLKYRNPDFIDGSVQTIADPDELNENFEDIARVVNGNLGGENLTPGVKLSLAKFECQRSNVVIPFNFGSDYLLNGTRPLYIACHHLRLISVAVCGANTVGAISWYVKNGATDTIMADLLKGHYGFTSYIVTDILLDALNENQVISLDFTGTGTIQGVTLFFTADHQT